MYIVRITVLGNNSLVFLYIAVKIVAVRETETMSKRRNCEKWSRCLLVSIPQFIVRKKPSMCRGGHVIFTVIAEHVIHTYAVVRGCSDPEQLCRA